MNSKAITFVITGSIIAAIFGILFLQYMAVMTGQWVNVAALTDPDFPTLPSQEQEAIRFGAAAAAYAAQTAIPSGMVFLLGIAWVGFGLISLKKK